MLRERRRTPSRVYRACTRVFNLLSIWEERTLTKEPSCSIEKKREKKEKEREFQTSAALHTARSIWYRLMAAGLLISLCAAPLRPLFLNFLITAFFVCSKVPSSRQGVAELIFAAFSIKHIGKIHHVTALACSRVRCGCLIVFYCAPSKP